MNTAPENMDSLSRIVALTFGHMENGGQYWCYVAVKPSRYDEFQKAMHSKAYNIQRFPDDGYGEVIVSGEGITPPSEVTRQVANLFNIPLKEFFKDIDPKKTIIDKLQYVGKASLNE